jgi:hypothetical protein
MWGFIVRYVGLRWAISRKRQIFRKFFEPLFEAVEQLLLAIQNITEFAQGMFHVGNFYFDIGQSITHNETLAEYAAI